MKSALQCSIYLVIASLLTNTSTAEEPPTAPPQAKSQLLASCVDTTAGLNVKGTIIIDKLDKTPRNPGDPPPVRFVCLSVTTGLKGRGLAPHYHRTDQVTSDLVANCLDQIPDLTSLRNHLLAKKPLDDSPPIASFTLYIVFDIYTTLTHEP